MSYKETIESFIYDYPILEFHYLDRKDLIFSKRSAFCVNTNVSITAIPGPVRQPLVPLKAVSKMRKIFQGFSFCHHCPGGGQPEF